MVVPKVSVVLPLHNGQAWVEESIRSVLEQSFEDLELIVVDDHSTDDGLAVVERIGRFDSRLHIVKSSQSGVAAARNLGVATSTGALLAFNDQDDIWTKHKLSLQVDLIRSKEQDLVLGKFSHFIERGFEAPSWVRPEMVTGNHVGWLLGTLLCTRSALSRLNGFDTAYAFASDMDFFMRAKHEGMSILIADALVLLKRLHGSNESGRPACRSELVRAVAAAISRKEGHR